MTPYDPTLRIPEDRIASILARAVDIDRNTRETISVDALRTAALDAGISPLALDTALEEYASAPEPALPAATPTARRRSGRFGRARAFLRRLVSPFRLGAIAFGVGLLTGLGEGTAVIGIVLWAVMAVRLARRYRPLRRARGFVAHGVLMTLGTALGFAAGGVDTDAVAVMVMVAVPVLLGGIAFIKVRLRRAIEAAAT